MKMKLGIFTYMTFVLFVTSLINGVVTAESAEKMAHLLYPKDLEYKGAFRFPKTTGQASTWAYGGGSTTYYPGGDANGPNDGYPGSIFGLGHSHHQLVGELSIPVPVISPTKDAKELNIAESLQPFADITEGKRKLDPISKRVGGLAYLGPVGNQLSDKIYWTVFDYYNAAGKDWDSHGRSSIDLSNPQSEGVWHLGASKDPSSMKTADYIFNIPKKWADLNLNGEYLVSGRVRENGAFGSSQGPALFSFGPYKYQNNALPNGTKIDVTPLLYYPAEGGHMPGYRACDQWTGGAWAINGDEDKSAVIMVGRQSLGEDYYGEARSTDCTSSKGFHCTPYESQILFYDPEELAQVAKGNKNPWDVVPYARMKLTPYVWATCAAQMSGAAWDPARGLLYVTQHQAEKQTSGERQPLMHVFQIGNGTGEETPPSDKIPPAPPTGLTVQPLQ